MDMVFFVAIIRSCVVKLFKMGVLLGTNGEVAFMDGVLYMKLLKATKTAFTELFKEHDEFYYYCTLVTTGDGNCPYISAWSWQALKKFLEQEEISKEEIIDYKWSYADSPYCAYGKEYFKEVEEYVLANKPKNIDDEEDWHIWEDALIVTMETVMSTLDEQGIFGLGAKRKSMLVNAEIMPPDYSNTQRALRLNNREDIRIWLKEAAQKVAGYIE